MVEQTSTFDLKRIPVITLSGEEIGKMQAEIEAGLLPKDYLEQHLDAVDANVFGADAQKDRQGWRLEQGLGSKNNQTLQSLEAYKRWCGPGKPQEEPKEIFEATVKRMEAEISASNEKRKVKAGKSKFTRGRVK